MGEHAARMGKMITAYNICLENLKETDHPKDLGIDGRIILQYIYVSEGVW
jgi:hypothetical protein